MLRPSSFILSSLLVSSLAFAAKPDTKATSEKIVSDVVGVAEGEAVWIYGDAADMDFLTDLNLAAAKRGGLSMVVAAKSGTFRRFLAEVPAKYDAQQGKLAEKLVALEDVVIAVAHPDDFTEDEGADPGRLTALGEARKNIDVMRQKEKVRFVEIGNGLTPTKANAKRLGVSQPELEKMFWGGINTDYKKLQASGAALKALVATGKELTVKTKGGTDLKLKMKPLMVSDGVISAEDVKAGGPNVATWLPAGEVYGLVDGPSAEGKITASVSFRGKPLKDITFTVKAGKVTDIAIKAPSKEFDAWKKIYDAAGAGKDALSIMDFGINPDVKAPKGKNLETFVPEGTVTLAIGGDSWAGGTNNVAWGQFMFLTDATVTVDGKTIVDAGALKLDAAPAAAAAVPGAK